MSGAHLVMGHHARRRAEAAKRGREDRQDEEAEEEDDEDEQDDGDGDGPSIYDEGLSLGYGTAYVGVELQPGAILARVGAPETVCLNSCLPARLCLPASVRARAAHVTRRGQPYCVLAADAVDSAGRCRARSLCCICPRANQRCRGRGADDERGGGS